MNLIGCNIYVMLFVMLCNYSRQLRDDCQRELQAHKEEREHLYQIKEKDWKAQLDNNGASLKSKMDEMARLLMHVEELSKKVGKHWKSFNFFRIPPMKII